MKIFIAFVVGGLLGFQSSKHDIFFKSKEMSVYLNGGVMSSSTIGTIYGYEDDWEGCNIHAKAMNFYFKSSKEMKTRIMSTSGNSFCSREPI